MKKILVLLVISLNLSAAIWLAPDHEHPSIAKADYGWMETSTKTWLNAYPVKDAKKFITEKELTRYTKLKIRNVYKDLTFEKSLTKGTSLTTLGVELYKYPAKNVPIYYGLIFLEAYSPIELRSKSKDYLYVMPITCHSSQCKQIIKLIVNRLVEKFVDDTYYIQDLIKKNK